MAIEIPVLNDNFDLESAIEKTKTHGYAFEDGAITQEIQDALASEIDIVPLVLGDYVSNPLNLGQPNQVHQRHSRAYYEYGDEAVPVANYVIESLALAVNSMTRYPELRSWRLSEVGYQRYRPTLDFIGPHRDRVSDTLLSITLMFCGSTVVKIHEPLGAYRDYSNLLQIDEVVTIPGTAMFLRAPGLGNGQQKIHEVLPPKEGIRNILNLRMRSTVLPPVVIL